MRPPGLGLVAAMAASLLAPEAPAPTARAVPRFTSDGALLQPSGFRDWVLAGASLGLSYAEPERDAGPGFFHNVYIEPGALAGYRKDGKFPEGTTLVMELFRPGRKTEPALSGYFEGERVGVEAAVKDSSRFRGGWGYFSFGDGSQKTARAFAGDGCAACHKAHAATDNVFTQFYPTLRTLPGSPAGSPAAPKLR